MIDCWLASHQVELREGYELGERDRRRIGRDMRWKGRDRRRLGRDMSWGRGIGEG